ncbi:AsmA-like C-terminal region-containing protein, partial [Candidatus Pelagibacter sp.]|nr:AsmA-like C-terminal region-containing protein [Candidatus Pelagibacter sp.]
LDATKLINNLMDDNEAPSVFHKLNTRIDIIIKKTHIDEINAINNLSGYLNFKNSKIDNLKLDSVFLNKKKKINLIINTNKAMETSTRLFTDYPKPLIKRYDFIKGFEEGYLEFNSSKKDNVSNSVLIINDFKIQEVPIFAKILSLASLQGIADILTGEGIRFTDFEMKFSNQKGLTTIEEMYAIGPAVSILMDGYIESKKLISLRGTVVPATTINKSIASIPLLGKILIGEKTGEGVFGVSFKIKGPPKDLSINVNPIKTLTPRFITRTLEKIKKN